MSWKTFLKAHWGAIAATDFLTIEVVTWRGLVRYFVLFVIDLETRWIEIAGVVDSPDGAWMSQVARNWTDCEDGFLLHSRYLIHDRDPLFSQAFRGTLESAGVIPIRLPRRSPNLNAYAERFVRSIKSECLAQVVPIGERHLRRAVREYVAHYHGERNHQGIGNRFIDSSVDIGRRGGPIQRREKGRGARENQYDDAVIARRDAVVDCLFLTLIVALSVLSYLLRLGFSSDDWTFLGYFQTNPDQSFLGLLGTENLLQMRSRPVQFVYLVSLYSCFGLAPFGYHLVNACVLGSGTLFFYLALRELSCLRMVALALPAVYGLLPDYATDRFWMASFEATLSMTLYFIGLYAALRMVRARRAWGGWALAAGGALLASALAYEVFLPLFPVIPLLAGYRAPLTAQPEEGQRWRVPVLIVGTALLAVVVAAFKAATTSRLGALSSLPVHLATNIRQAFAPAGAETDYGLNLERAGLVHFTTYGLGLPHAAWRLARAVPDAANVGVAVVVALTVLGYLRHVLGRPGAALPSLRLALVLLGAGLGVFGLGYSIFIVYGGLQLTPSGIGNRTAIAAAVGVAASLVGVIGFLTSGLPAAWRRIAFPALVALVCGAGCAVTNSLASYWIDAYARARQVITDIERTVPALPPETTLLLDGICPYLGPAVVFESSWDLAGALAIVYGDRSLRADVVTPALEVDDDAIITRLYGTRYSYPYDRLLVYHAGRRTIDRLSDAATARRYLAATVTERAACPHGSEGFGVPVL
jgi:hypothetical protein